MHSDAFFTIFKKFSIDIKLHFWRKKIFYALLKVSQIRKDFFQAEVSSKKWTNRFDFTTCRLVFVCFLEESEDTKKTVRNQLTFITQEITSYIRKNNFWMQVVLCSYVGWFWGRKGHMFASKASKRRIGPQIKYPLKKNGSYFLSNFSLKVMTTREW